MKIAIWVVFGLLAGFWTLGAVVVAEVTQWASRVVAAGAVHDLGRAAAEWPAPAWLAIWVDPEGFRTFKSMAVWTLDALSDAVPFVESTLGLLVPIVWVMWGVGFICLVAVAGLAHWLAGRSGRVLRSDSVVAGR